MENEPATPGALAQSPEITTKALNLYVKQKEKKSFCFAHTHLRLHYTPCQVQSPTLQGWIFTSHCCKAWVLVITSIYFNVICLGSSSSNWMKDSVALDTLDTTLLLSQATYCTDNSTIAAQLRRRTTATVLDFIILKCAPLKFNHRCHTVALCCMVLEFTIRTEVFACFLGNMVSRGPWLHWVWSWGLCEIQTDWSRTEPGLHHFPHEFCPSQQRASCNHSQVSCELASGATEW